MKWSVHHVFGDGVGCHVHDNGEAPFPIPVYRQVAVCHVVASAYPIPGVYEHRSSDKKIHASYYTT